MSIGVVGKGTNFVIYGEEETGRLLTAIEGEERRGTVAAAAEEDPPAPAGDVGVPADAAADPDVAMDTE